MIEIILRDGLSQKDQLDDSEVETRPVVNCTEQSQIPTTLFCRVIGETVEVNVVGVCKKTDELGRCVYRTH